MPKTLIRIIATLLVFTFPVNSTASGAIPGLALASARCLSIHIHAEVPEFQTQALSELIAAAVFTGKSGNAHGNKGVHDLLAPIQLVSGLPPADASNRRLLPEIVGGDYGSTSEETLSGAAPNVEIRDPQIASVFMAPLQELFNTLPNHWVLMPTAPQGKKIFVRGLSNGAVGVSKEGYREALALLSDRIDGQKRHVEFIHSSSIPESVVGTLRRFASPLAIQGTADDELDELSAVVRIAGVKSIGAIALVTPGELIYALGWAESYVSLLEALIKDGLTLHPHSEGSIFYSHLKEAVATSHQDRTGALNRLWHLYQAAISRLHQIPARNAIGNPHHTLELIVDKAA